MAGNILSVYCAFDSKTSGFKRGSIVFCAGAPDSDAEFFAADALAQELSAGGAGASFAGGGFTLVTKNCPQWAACKSGKFLEVACSSYTRGLLSQMGDFEITSRIGSGVCAQEFRVRILAASAGSKPWAGTHFFPVDV